MINQMWSQKLYDKVGAWQDAFEAWAMVQENGFVDPIEWIKQNGMPSSDPAISQAYKEMQQENRRREPALRAAYELINPCPVKPYKK